MGVVFTAGKYIHWGVVSISLTNFLIIVGMIVIFVLALVIPFPGTRDDRDANEDDS
jgi:hypothetical protein